MKFFLQFFLCGIFTSLLFPPFFLLPIGFVVFPFLFSLLIDRKYNNLSYSNHFFSGFIFGCGFFGIYLLWVKQPFLTDALTENYYLFSYVLIIYCALYFGIIFSILKFIKKNIIKLIVLPGLIVIAEFVCANLSYGFPWFSFSLIHSNNIFGTSLIFYVGTYTLSFLTIIIFLFPILFILKKIMQIKFIFLFYIILLFIIILLIFFRQNNINNSNSSYKTISIVQLNSPPNQYLDKKQINNKYENIIEIIKNDQSNIIIFGENNFPFLMDDKNISIIQKYIKENQYVIIGANSKVNTKYFNSMFLINSLNYQKFDKQILVPFGEFVPLRSLFGFMDIITGSIDFSEGKKKRILDLNNQIKILPVICYEIIFFWKLINEHNYHSDLIVNITNDSWFGKFSGPYQHFYFTKLRAAEFNKSILRVSNNGVSAGINNYGQIIDYIELDKKLIKTIKFYNKDVEDNYLSLHQLLLILIFLSVFFSLFINIKNEK